ncbi:MAG: Holliday junction branch migration protein RuvA [Chloroflexota bacterium]
MIASLRGRLEALGSDWAVIDVNGVGFQVYLPTSTLSTLGATGKEVYLYTYLHMREDNLTLYGFTATEERELFQLLLGVSGIGPRTALSVLSTMTVDQVSTAIATGDVDLLATVPGIGKRTAGRLVLELKDKIGKGWVVTTAAQMAGENADVMAALTSLGYSVNEASRAVAGLPADVSLEEKIKLALQYLGGGK